MTAIETMQYLYDHAHDVSYSEIAMRLELLKESWLLDDLKSAAAAFGVVPTRNTKAGILEAVRRKIETRKTTKVRCEF